jgi:alkanesulfonate monooxygenase SsuD/methylene tetrahydromethanopterin reductase-like flavin-dependent oxidoreductase (luciferase family)
VGRRCSFDEDVAVRLGLYFDGRNSDRQPWSRLYEELLEVSCAAEELGAHSLWFSEHHGFADGYLPQPLTMAAAVAARTSRVRLGTAVLVAGLRPPALIAEEAAVVDILSSGRLDLGLGAGYRPDEAALYGAAMGHPLTTLFERIDEVHAMFRDGSVTPPPVQAPLPTWVGGNGPRAARWAAARGLPLLSLRRTAVLAYLQAWSAGGRPPEAARVAGPVNAFVADDPDAVREVVVAGYDRLWASYAAATEGSASDGHVVDRIDARQALRRGFRGGLAGLVIDTPERVADLLATQLAGLPVEVAFSWARLPGVPRELLDRHVELWCGPVQQRLRSHPSTTSNGAPE